MGKNRIISFICLGCAAFIGLFTVISPQYKFVEPEVTNATVLKTQEPLKSFNLIDTNGNTFNEKSLKGHWTLMFFGYMNCPTICPKTLNLVRQAWMKYTPSKPAPARFVFANITPIQNPKSDFSEFLKNYNENFIGVSANDDSIIQLSSQLGVFASSSEDGEIDHTASLMLINPQGQLKAIFSPPIMPEDLVSDLNKIIG